MKGVRLFTADKRVGLVNALGKAYPEAMWQRCVVHRNVFTAVPNGKMRKVARMLKAIHAQEGVQADGLNGDGSRTAETFVRRIPCGTRMGSVCTNRADQQATAFRSA